MRRPQSAEPVPASKRGGTSRFALWIVLGALTIYLVVLAAWPDRSWQGFKVADFGRLPVSLKGRVQPIDSVGRLALLQIQGTVIGPPEEAGAWRFWSRARGLGATEWLLELMTKPDAADRRRVFVVREADLAKALDLKAASSPRTYSFSELKPKLQSLTRQVVRILKVKAANRAGWERECLQLRSALVVYERLKNSLQPNSDLQEQARGGPITYDFAAELARYHADLGASLEAALDKEHGRRHDLDAATEQRLRTFARPFVPLSQAALIAIVPPTARAASRDRWSNIGDTIVASSRTGQVSAAVTYFATMSSAFAGNKPDDFNRAVAEYRQWLAASGLRAELSRARSEYFANRLQPLVRATPLYLIALVLVCAAWWRRSKGLYRSSATLVIAACALHAGGLLFDTMLEGRLPVTNLYSSILLTGWGAALLGLAAERFARNGLGLGGAALAGLAALIVAHNLAPGGAAQLVRAALDLPFWAALGLALAAGVVVSFLGSDEGVTRAPARPDLKTEVVPALPNVVPAPLGQSAFPPPTQARRVTAGFGRSDVVRRMQ